MSEKDGGNTVFINKLYDLLENKDLDDLIWWAANGESFLIRPSESFSQNLAHYFKHTNITSFVRQLNIYGFHKISNDHFHNLKREKKQKSSTDNNTGVSNNNSGDENIKVWEFKHSGGLFKKGDLENLKLIKRRSSSRTIPSLSLASSNTNTSTLETNDGAEIDNVKVIASAVHNATEHLKKKDKVKKEGKKSSKKSTKLKNEPTVDISNTETTSAAITNESEQSSNKRATRVYKSVGTISNQDSKNPEKLTKKPKKNSNLKNKGKKSKSNSVDGQSIDNIQPNENQPTNIQVNTTEIPTDNTLHHYNETLYEQSIQLNHQIAQMRNTNMDMLAILELMSKLAEMNKEVLNINNSEKIPELMANHYRFFDAQLTSLKNNILDRINNTNIHKFGMDSNDLRSASQTNIHLSHPIAQNMVYSSSDQAIPKSVPYYLKQGQRTSPDNGTTTPAGAQNYSKNQVVQHPQAANDYFSSVHVQTANPFEKFQTEKNGIINVTARRHMSVLVDPLTPASMMSVPTTTQSSLSGPSLYNQQHAIIFPHDLNQAFNSRSEPTITPITGHHSNFTRASDSNLMNTKQTIVNSMKNRASYPSRRTESPLKYSSGMPIEEEQRWEYKTTKDNGRNTDIPQLPSNQCQIDSPVPVRSPYNKFVSPHSFYAGGRNISPPMNGNVDMLAQRPSTEVVSLTSSDNKIDNAVVIKRSSTANPILRGSSSEKENKESSNKLIGSTVTEKTSRTKRNSSGVYSLLNGTIKEEKANETFIDTDSHVDKKIKL